MVFLSHEKGISHIKQFPFRFLLFWISRRQDFSEYIGIKTTRQHISLWAISWALMSTWPWGSLSTCTEPTLTSVVVTHLLCWKSCKPIRGRSLHTQVITFTWVFACFVKKTRGKINPKTQNDPFSTDHSFSEQAQFPLSRSFSQVGKSPYKVTKYHSLKLRVFF